MYFMALILLLPAALIPHLWQSRNYSIAIILNSGLALLIDSEKGERLKLIFDSDRCTRWFRLLEPP
jgi:hypothetical protein